MSEPPNQAQNQYRGRVAPTPSGNMHLGHAATFRTAWQRARLNGGKVFLRIEDLDYQRCKEEYTEAWLEDLDWLGIECDTYEGDGQKVVYQSSRMEEYREVLKDWIDRGLVYPCSKSRKEIQEYDPIFVTPQGETVFPEKWKSEMSKEDFIEEPWHVNWRANLNYGKKIEFNDLNLGSQSYTAGREFGDFLVWSKLGCPSYEMAVVLDDSEMEITEVVRGEDLLVSTARQKVLFEWQNQVAPDYFHCPLIIDSSGKRLSKSKNSKSIRDYRADGLLPDDVFSMIDANLNRL